MARQAPRYTRSLNPGSGRKRFVFRSFARRLEAVDIDVFRSLAPTPAAPAGTSTSFFHESLLRWRELNSAADFNTLYQELLPLVQTMPQLLHHRDAIVSALLSRMRLDAALSLDPILSLTAILARDLREDFLPFLPSVLGALTALLLSGADHDPDLLEQVFTCVSYTFKYLVSFLAQDLVLVLRCTKRLRFHKEKHIRLFVAEAVAYLLRQAPLKQLIRGVRRLLREAEVSSSPHKISGCAAVLAHTLQGPSHGLHSRSGPLLHLLLDKSTLSREGSMNHHVAALVVAETLDLLCQHVHRKMSSPIWQALLDELHGSLPSSAKHEPIAGSGDRAGSGASEQAAETTSWSKHAARVLFVLSRALEHHRGSRVDDYGPLFQLAETLMQPLILSRFEDTLQANILINAGPLAPLRKPRESASHLSMQSLRLLLALINNHTQVAGASIGPAAIVKAAPSWSMAFSIPDCSIMIPFLGNLVQADATILQLFSSSLLSFLDRHISTHPTELLPLLLDVCLKLEPLPAKPVLLVRHEKALGLRLAAFVTGLLRASATSLTDNGADKAANNVAEDGQLWLAQEPAIIWTALQCLPYATQDEQEGRELCAQLIAGLETRMAEDEKHADTRAWEGLSGVTGSSDQRLWQCLLGVAASAHSKMQSYASSEEMQALLPWYLELAKRHQGSAPVLLAVAAFLDSHSTWMLRLHSPQSQEHMVEVLDTVDMMQSLHSNLASPDRELRVASLKVLRLLESARSAASTHSPQSPTLKAEPTRLLAIEEAPLQLDCARQSCTLISHLEKQACNSMAHPEHVAILASSMIGVLQIPFAVLWEAASDCLSGLLGSHTEKAWPIVIQHLQAVQDRFLQWLEERESICVRGSTDDDAAPIDVWRRFHDTCTQHNLPTDPGTTLGLLLKTLQNVPSLAEGRSRTLIPLFLAYNGDGSGSSEWLQRGAQPPSLGPQSGGGKAWREPLKEWLTLLRNMKNARAFFCGPQVKGLLLIRHLPDGNPIIQQLALECLVLWRDDFIVPYVEHLRNLISTKSLKEELVTWRVDREGGSVPDKHRRALVEVVIQILFPKLIKRSSKTAGKSAGVDRSTVLAFLANLDSSDILPLFERILRPLSSAFILTPKGTEADSDRSWEGELAAGVRPNFLEFIDTAALAAVPVKRQVGFLHLVTVLAGTFSGDVLRSYLHALVAVTLRCLEGCSETYHTPSLAPSSMSDAAREAEGVQGQDEIDNDLSDEVEEARDSSSNGKLVGRERLRELRTLSLRTFGVFLAKFPELDYTDRHWDVFFGCIKSSIAKLAATGSGVGPPRALLSIFTAMAASSTLAPLLGRDRDLLPALLGTLASPVASAAVTDLVLEVVENMLDTGGPGRAVLLSHLPTILACLKDLLTHRRQQQKGLASVHWEMKLLVRLSRHVVTQEDSSSLVDVLLPFLRARKRVDQGACVEVLSVVERLAHLLPASYVAQALPVLGPLFVSMSNREEQLALCNVVLAFSLVDLSLTPLAGLLLDLRSMSSDTIGEYDYERRLGAYGRVDAAFLSKLSRPQAMLLLSVAVHDMGEADMSVRHSASGALQVFLRFAAALPEDAQAPVGEPDEGSMVMHALDASSDVCVEEKDKGGEYTKICTGGSLRTLLTSLLLPHVRTFIGSSEISTTRREWVLLLREMVVLFPSAPSLLELAPLLNEDVETDFFHNITHIQVHRRIRAMARFRQITQSVAFSQGALLRIFLPLFQHCLYEARGDKEGNLVEAALQSLAHLSSLLPWEPYYGLLMRCIRLLVTKAQHQKVLVRLLCAILDNFHFYVKLEADKRMGTGDVVEEPAIVPQSQDVCANGLQSSSSGERSEERGRREVPAPIQRVLLEKVLPELRKYMVSDMDIANSTVALAVVKCLRLMPSATVAVELPAVLQGLANLLRSRGQGVRDVARATLAAVAAELGGHYLQYTLEVLAGTLDRGYMMHILGYTVHAILYKMAPVLRPGEIDEASLDKLLSVIENDVMGEVAEEREVDAIASKMKETRHMRSFDSLRLLSQAVDFQKSGSRLLGPVRASVARSSAKPGTKAKLKEMLRQIAIGVQANPTCTPNALLVFVYSLVEDGLATVAAPSAKAPAAKDLTAAASLPRASTAADPNTYLSMDFALQLLHAGLKRWRPDGKDPQLLAMLDPFVALLCRCLVNKYDSVLAQAIKSLCILVRLPLPAIGRFGQEILGKAFEIVGGRSVRSGGEVVQTCLKLLATLLQHCSTIQISNEQLLLLLQAGVFADLEAGATRSTAFSLLQAVLSRRLVVPEIYDLMHSVAELMVRSYTPAVCQLCAQALLKFLLDYPLGPKRLQQHIDFVVTNLSFEHASGREAAMEMLHAIILKFPASVVEEQAEGLFVPLAARLVVDTDPRVRAMVGVVVKALLVRVGPHVGPKLLAFAFTWLRGDDARLWRPAAQVIGYAVEVMGAQFEKHAEEWLEACTRILRLALALDPHEAARPPPAPPAAGVEGGTSEGGQVGARALRWQAAYFCLAATEKLLSMLPQLVLHPGTKDLWSLSDELLLFPHLWVRKAAARLVGLRLAAHGSTPTAAAIEAAAPEDALHPAQLLMLAGASCCQLDAADVVDESLAEQVSKNLLFVASALPLLQACCISNTGGGLPVYVGCEEGRSLELASRGLAMLQPRRRQRQALMADVVDGSKVEDSLGDEALGAVGQTETAVETSGSTSAGSASGSARATASHALMAVFQRMSRIALRLQPVPATAAVRWLAAMLAQLEPQGTATYLHQALDPLYRIAEGAASKQVPEELKVLAAEALEHVREVVGVPAFVEAYAKVRQSVMARRETRRAAAAVAVLVDPERAARQRGALAVKRQAQKKRKVAEHKRKRGVLAAGDDEGTSTKMICFVH
eukprot:SM000093S24444  [mRNA]  locus=s93:494111:510484:+ [translate_table: standard]